MTNNTLQLRKMSVILKRQVTSFVRLNDYLTPVGDLGGGGGLRKEGGGKVKPSGNTIIPK